MEGIMSVLRYRKYDFPIIHDELLQIIHNAHQEKFGLQVIAQALITHFDSTACMPMGRGGMRCQQTIKSPSAFPVASFTCLVLGSGDVGSGKWQTLNSGRSSGNS